VTDVIKIIRFRYLVFSCLLIFFLKFNSIKFLFFLGFFNLVYLSTSAIFQAIRGLQRIEFTKNEKISALEKTINQYVDSNQNILVILLDGFPSEKILKEKYSLKTIIRDSLKGIKYQENAATYISTPLSTVNQLFGVNFEDTSQIVRNDEDIPGLFSQSYSTSRLKLKLLEYETFWSTFLISQSQIVKYSIWKNQVYRGLAPFIVQQVFRKTSKTNNLNKEFESYNKIAILSLRNHKWDTRKKNFYFIHMLTFHNDFSVQEEVNYAERYLLDIIKCVPKSTKVIIFSDHGIRFEPGFSDDEMRSGILYYF
jgi:hypothetical protein